MWILFVLVENEIIEKSFFLLFFIFFNAYDPESRDYVVCKGLHDLIYFVVNVQRSPVKVSRYIFQTFFFAFSTLSSFFLQSFTRKENKFLILLFYYQGGNIFITSLSTPKFLCIILSILSPLHFLHLIDP